MPQSRPATVRRGRPRGDRFQTVVDVRARPDEADALAASVREWLVSSDIVSEDRTGRVLGDDLGHPPGPRAHEVVEDHAGSWSDLWTNGLEITTGRTRLDPGQGDPTAVSCPHCGATTEPLDEDGELIGELWAPSRDAVDDWEEGRDAHDPTEWRWEDECLVLAHSGLTFWNWPELRPEFVAELGRLPDEHRTTVLVGKL